MAEQWQRELDKRLMDPDYRDEYQRELDRQCAAGEAMDKYHNDKAVIGVADLRFKPGETVKYLDKTTQAPKEGLAVGAYEMRNNPEHTYIVLERCNGVDRVVEVPEASLIRGWGLSKDTAEIPEGYSEDDIPF